MTQNLLPVIVVAASLINGLAASEELVPTLLGGHCDYLVYYQDVGGSVSSSTNYSAFQKSANQFLVSMREFGEPFTVWRTNGTVGGSYPLDLPAALGSPYLFASTDTHAFVLDLAAPVPEIWSIDTASEDAMLLGSFVNLLIENEIPSSASVGGYVYFAENDPDPAGGVRLWQSDGSIAGTTLFWEKLYQDLLGDPTEITPEELPDGIQDLRRAGGNLVFTAHSSNSYKVIYRSDGTPGSVEVVFDPCPPPPNGPAFNRQYIQFLDSGGEESIYFTTSPAPGNYRLDCRFRRLLRMNFQTLDVDEVTDSGLIEYVGKLEGADLLSDGYIGLRIETSPNEWEYLLSDAEMNYSYMEHGVAAGTTLFMRGATLGHASDLWRTDGTPAGTFALRDLSSAPHDDNVLAPFANLERGLTPTTGDSIYFYAFDEQGDLALWRSGGTAGSTERLVDLNPDGGILQWGGSTGQSGPLLEATSPMAVVLNNRLIFWGTQGGDSGHALWALDLGDDGCPDCTPQRKTFYEVGQDVCLQLEGPDLETVGQVQWYKEGEGALEEGRYLGVQCPTLSIPDVRLVDSGTYRCEYGSQKASYVITLEVATVVPALSRVAMALAAVCLAILGGVAQRRRSEQCNV